jgi:hypothetical protein
MPLLTLNATARMPATITKIESTMNNTALPIVMARSYVL